MTSIYKPPNFKFAFEKPSNFDTKNIHIIIGDLNSLHTNLGYEETDNNGHQVEVGAGSNRLKLIHDLKLPPSFNSGRWKEGYNPDIIFVSDVIAPNVQRRSEDPYLIRNTDPYSAKLWQ